MRAIITGPDGNLYMATAPKGHILRFNPATSTFKDLGRPSPVDKELWVWSMALGPDRKIYAGSSPSAKLIRLDPVSGRLEVLGRMDPSQPYIRSIAASSDGFVYMAVGMEETKIVAYEISTGRFKDILPQAYHRHGEEPPRIELGQDGKVYAFYSTPPIQVFRLEKWTATPRLPGVAIVPRIKLKRGDSLFVDSSNRISLKSSTGKQIRMVPIDYRGRERTVARLALGPDGRLYIGGAITFNLMSVDPVKHDLTDVGVLGGGEAYSFLPVEGKLAMAVYDGFKGNTLMLLDPSRPLDIDDDPPHNPAVVPSAKSFGYWRPLAMIMGSDKQVYIGGLPSYGIDTGVLTVWNPKSGIVKTHEVCEKQSINSLCYSAGRIIAGTTIVGGTGTKPSTTNAKLFQWNPDTKKKDVEIIPVPGSPTINDLVNLPDGKVFGVALRDRPFVYDPYTGKVKVFASLPFECGSIYNGAAMGSDGKIWGLSKQGIFYIDPISFTGRIAYTPASPITAGFAIDERAVYFACGADVFRYIYRSAP